MKNQNSYVEQLPYRKCVGIMLINQQGLVWIGKRSSVKTFVNKSQVWQMPQGGIDKNEDPFEAAKRELYEETSVKSVKLLGASSQWYSYEIPESINVDNKRLRKFQGQTQKWFAFEFTGDDSEINIHTPPDNHRPEFEEWRWEKLSQLPGLVIPFKREVYLNVVAEFSKFTH